MEITQYSSMLDRLNAGQPINVQDGSFGKPGGGNLTIVKDDYHDMQALVTGTSQYKFFDGTRSNNPNLTNCTAAVVPGGERYDLYGLDAYLAPATTAGTLTEAQYGLFREFVRSASITVALSSITIIQEPLMTYFGNQGFQTSYLSTVTAAVGPSNAQLWRKRWPDQLYFTLQSTVQMTFTLNLTGYTTASGLSGMYLGFSFPRVKASKV